MLGYHVSIGDKSMETSARDSLAAPLRDLEAVIVKIRSGAFTPDVTRSGFMTPGGQKADEKAGGEAPASEHASSTCPSSCSSVSSLCSEDDSVELSSAEVAGDNGSVVRNVATGCFHILSAPGRLRCGKTFPKVHEIVVDLPLDARTCPRCF